MRNAIREVPGTDLGPKTAYPHYGFRGFPQSIQVNAGVVTFN
jgi:hypothetical protein